MPKINTHSARGLPIFKILKLEEKKIVFKLKIFKKFQKNFKLEKKIKIRKISKKFKIFIIRFQNDKIFKIFNEKCSKFS